MTDTPTPQPSKLIIPGQAGEIINPREPAKPAGCPHCIELRSALDFARAGAKAARSAADSAIAAGKLAHESQKAMHEKLVAALTTLHAIAQYPAEGAEDNPTEPESAAKAREAIDRLL